MVPFLRDSDVVELEPVPAPRLADMLLLQAATPGTAERYVLHRIVREDGRVAFFIRGDAQERWEGPFTRGDVLGKVVLSYRNGSPRVMDCGPWHLAGLVWAGYGPLGRWLLSLAVHARAKARGMLRRLQQPSIFRA